MTDGTRDLIWDAMHTFAERINASGRTGDLEVRPIRRTSLSRFRVVEGLWVGDRQTDVFEAVRVRRLLGRRWRDLQSVSEAAAKIGQFIATRPDLS
jgi:hypothetical protein